VQGVVAEFVSVGLGGSCNPVQGRLCSSLGQTYPCNGHTFSFVGLFDARQTQLDIPAFLAFH
jgi:hypothetical protein